MSSPGSSGRAEFSVCQLGWPSGKRRAHMQRAGSEGSLEGRHREGTAHKSLAGRVPARVRGGAWPGHGRWVNSPGLGGVPGSGQRVWRWRVSWFQEPAPSLQEGARAGLPGGVSVNKHAVGVQRAAQGAAPPSCSPTPTPRPWYVWSALLRASGGQVAAAPPRKGPQTACLAFPSPPRAFSSMTPPSLPTPIFALCSLPTPQTLYPWRHSCLLGYL